MLIVLDDLQWADELTRAFLASASELLDHHAVFLLATVRAEELTPEVDAVLRGARGRAARRAAARPRLGRRDGARHARARRRRPAAHRFPSRRGRRAIRCSPRSTCASPSTRACCSATSPGAGGSAIAAAATTGCRRRARCRRWLRQKLVGLSEPARRLVFAAAVLGRPANAAVLAQTAGLDAADARRALGELIRRHVAEEVSGDEPPARARHAARAGLRRAAAGRARARLHGARSERDRGGDRARAALRRARVSLCEQAGEARRALDYTELAAERALATAAYGDARRCSRSWSPATASRSRRRDGRAGSAASAKRATRSAISRPRRATCARRSPCSTGRCRRRPRRGRRRSCAASRGSSPARCARSAVATAVRFPDVPSSSRPRSRPAGWRRATSSTTTRSA